MLSVFVLIFMSCMSALVEIIDSSNGHSVNAFTMSQPNTVHYIVIELFEVTSQSLEKITDSTLTTRLRVFHEDPNFESQPVHDDKKRGSKNDFFFMASMKGQYTFLITVDGPGIYKYKKFGIDYKIYQGEENRPSIVSVNDVEVSKAENLIKGILDYAKKNMVIQEVEFQDEKIPVDVYSGIIKKAILMIGLKIISTIGTSLFSSFQTKRFFASQNRANK